MAFVKLQTSNIKEQYMESDLKDKIEMLHDIAALANAGGGYLILGIEEDGKGRAKRFFPIDDLSVHTQAINLTCLDGIEDRIQGLEVTYFEIEQDKGIIVIRVPQSQQLPHMVIKDQRTDFYRRYGTDKRTMKINEIRSQILSNPVYRRLVELELLAQMHGGQNEAEKKTTKKEVAEKKSESPLTYIQLFTHGSVEQFINRYLISYVNVRILVIISPFIADLEGEKYSLKDLLDKAKKNRTRVYVITRPPEEEYQKKSMGLIYKYPNVELRYNTDVHAKLFVCWGKEVDESFALFGSANLTPGGLRHNLELGMMILSKDHGQTLVTDLYQWGNFSVRSISPVIKKIDLK